MSANSWSRHFAMLAVPVSVAMATACAAGSPAKTGMPLVSTPLPATTTSASHVTSHRLLDIPSVKPATFDPLTSGGGPAGFATHTRTPRCQINPDGLRVDEYGCYSRIVADDGIVAVDVRATACESDDTHVGIDFRNQGDYYLFLITPTGYWGFAESNSDGLISRFIVEPEHSDAVRVGRGVVNTLVVNFRGSHFEFGANGALLGTADDKHLKGLGLLGVQASFNCTALFTNFRYWP